MFQSKVSRCFQASKIYLKFVSATPSLSLLYVLEVQFSGYDGFEI